MTMASTTDKMADMDNQEQAQADLLNWMQMEALGIKRREKITTADFKENRDYTSVSQLEGKRKALGGNYKPAKQSQSKIFDWKNVYHAIQDDGTLAPSDLRSVNEGLGQTHRAKLLDDDTVRIYSGEPGHHKARFHHKPVKAVKAVKAAMAPARVTRGRVLKGNSPSSATLKGYPSPAKFLNRSLSPAEVLIRHHSSAKKTTTIQAPPLTDPQAWLTSIQGIKQAAARAVKQPDPEPTPKATQPPTPETTHKPIQQSTPEDASVSVAFLMSLGVKFTKEQLRALTAQIQKGTDDAEMSIPNDRKSTRLSTAQDENIVNVIQRPITNNQNATESLVARDQVVTNPAKHTVVDNQKSSKPLAVKHQSVTNAMNVSAARPQDEEIAISPSRSDALCHQRDMIIGSQIYKNRYSLVAGSLVDSFQELTLTDPNPEPTPTAQSQPTTHNNAMTQPTIPAPRAAAAAPSPMVSNAPAAAPALRPRFIPDAPVPVRTIIPPATLTPRSVNPTLAVENPFRPARRSRAGGPSLPPHLMGKVASSDPGAAARAQYGNK